MASGGTTAPTRTAVGERPEAGVQPRFRFRRRRGEPSRDGQFASVIHITDIHLNRIHVGVTGRKRLQQQLLTLLDDPIGAGATAIARTYLKGTAAGANPQAWRALKPLMELVVVQQRDRAPVVVAQTGDVEAIGADANGRHRGYEELHGAVWPRLETLGAECVDVYGNHDIWPHMLFGRKFGTLHRDGPAQLTTQHPRLQGPWQERRIATRAGAPDVCFHRVCTVDPSVRFGAMLAQGRVGTEPVPSGLRPPRAIADRLEERLRHTEDFHIVLTHHPLRGVFGRKLLAVVRGAKPTTKVIGDQALVISGHLHHMYPAFDEKAKQPQLVADSPTVIAESKSTSMAVYLLVDQQMGAEKSEQLPSRVRVDRLVYTYDSNREYAEPPRGDSGIATPHISPN